MIRVLVVDDSALVRRILTHELGKQPGIEVVGTAVDPYVARTRIAELEPDVLTLDLELPRMDGLTFLEKIMTYAPMPVVVVSSLAPENSPMATRALTLGAIAVVAKPDGSTSVPESMEALGVAIRLAARARPQRLEHRLRAPGASNTATSQGQSGLLSETTDVVVAIGASTGGPVAIERVLAELPPTFPGVLVSQHMASAFTRQFAEHLARTTSFDVREAKDGDQVTRGRVLVAPGGKHLELRRNGAHYVVRLGDGPPEHHVKPAADVMFRSVARHAGANAVGVVLTGMGVDGAEGLLEMRRAGASTFVQDEDSCVVFGMPAAALKLGAADRIVALDRIAGELVSEVRAASLRADGRRVAV